MQATMTEFDKKLIEEAESMSRYDYRDVDALIMKAESEEACERLRWIQYDLRELVYETN